MVDVAEQSAPLVGRSPVYLKGSTDMTATRKPRALAGLSLSSAPATSKTANPAAPVSTVSGKWADEVIARLSANGKTAPDREETVSWLESSSVAMLREELLTLSAELQRVAKSLTAHDVKVIGKHDGTSAALRVTGISPETMANPGGWSQAHVRVTIDPSSVLGAALRASGVAPREAKPATR